MNNIILPHAMVSTLYQKQKKITGFSKQNTFTSIELVVLVQCTCVVIKFLAIGAKQL